MSFIVSKLHSKLSAFYIGIEEPIYFEFTNDAVIIFIVIITKLSRRKN